jgi:hypothetical protein
MALQPMQKAQQPATAATAQPKAQAAQQPAAQPMAGGPVKKKSKWWLWLIVIIVSIAAGFLIGAII